MVDNSNARVVCARTAKAVMGYHEYLTHAKAALAAWVASRPCVDCGTWDQAMCAYSSDAFQGIAVYEKDFGDNPTAAHDDADVVLAATEAGGRVWRLQEGSWCVTEEQVPLPTQEYAMGVHWRLRFSGKFVVAVLPLDIRGTLAELYGTHRAWET